MYKKSSWSSVLVVIFLLLAVGLLSACQPEPVEVEVAVVETVVVTETIVEEGETVEVTRIVEVPVTVVAEPAEPVAEEVVQEEGPSGHRHLYDSGHLDSLAFLDDRLGDDHGFHHRNLNWLGLAGRQYANRQ